MTDHLLDGIMMSTHSSQAQGIQIKTQVEEMPSDEPQAAAPTGLTLTQAPSSQELVETNLNSQFPPERFKASNFPALSLQIGPWKVVSTNSCIIAKFYYGKQRIVWEMTLDGMKKKMDIKWARVSAINTIYTQGRSDTLEIEVEKPPKFYFESNLPRGRTTKWSRGVDFTSSYAEIYRRHTVEFREGTLENHYVKLLHADDRLNELSQRPFPAADSSIFFDWVPIKERLMLTELALHRPSASVLAMQQHLAQQATTQLRSQVRTVEAPARDFVSCRSADTVDDFVSSPHLVPLQTAPVLILPTIRSASRDYPFCPQANDCNLGSVPVSDTGVQNMAGASFGINPLSGLPPFVHGPERAGSAFGPYTNVGGQVYDFSGPNLLAGPGLRNADGSEIVPENAGSEARARMPLPSIVVPPKKRRCD